MNVHNDLSRSIKNNFDTFLVETEACVFKQYHLMFITVKTYFFQNFPVLRGVLIEKSQQNFNS